MSIHSSIYIHTFTHPSISLSNCPSICRSICLCLSHHPTISVQLSFSQCPSVHPVSQPASKSRTMRYTSMVFYPAQAQSKRIWWMWRCWWWVGGWRVNLCHVCMMEQIMSHHKRLNSCSSSFSLAGMWFAKDELVFIFQLIIFISDAKSSIISLGRKNWLE